MRNKFNVNKPFIDPNIVPSSPDEILGTCPVCKNPVTQEDIIPEYFNFGHSGCKNCECYYIYGFGGVLEGPIRAMYLGLKATYNIQNPGEMITFTYKEFQSFCLRSGYKQMWQKWVSCKRNPIFKIYCTYDKIEGLNSLALTQLIVKEDSPL